MDDTLLKLKRKLLEDPWNTLHEWLQRKLIQFAPVVELPGDCSCRFYPERGLHASLDGVEVCHTFRKIVWNLERVRMGRRSELLQAECDRCGAPLVPDYMTGQAYCVDMCHYQGTGAE